MEEIGNHVFMENSYAGVALGAIELDQGLLLIDSPLTAADQQSWRRQTGQLCERTERIVLMLDTHIDRTVGLSAMGGTVLGHDNAVEILSSRPVPLRSQDLAAGSEIEAVNLPANERWALPAMTFSQDIQFHLDGNPVQISHRPGGHLAGCWVHFDQAKIIFVGDSIVEHQPPFLAWADLDAWLAELAELQAEPWAAYRIISSRSGLIRRKAIEKQAQFIQQIKECLPDLVGQEDREGAIADLLPGLLRKISFDRKMTNLYRRRLAYGLSGYLKRCEALKRQDE